MRAWPIAVYSVIATFFVLLSGNVKAQSYINFSKYTGGIGNDASAKMKVVNNETYLMAITTSADFPVTNGSTYSGKRDMALTKYNSAGAVAYSIYLGGKGDDSFMDMKIVNGEVYITGTSDSSGYPVTNGSFFHGQSDVIVTKIAANGSIVFSTYIGGSLSDYIPNATLQLEGNELFLAGTTSSLNFPATGGSVYKGGTTDGFLTKINATTGAIISSQFVGGNFSDNVSSLNVAGGAVYFTCSTESSNLPITIGSPPAVAGRHNYAGKLNSTDFSVVFARYITGSAGEFMTNARVVNNEMHMAGFTYSRDYPVTNGSLPSGDPNVDLIDGFYTRLNANGSLGFSTYLTTDGLDIISSLTINNGNAYVGGVSISNTILKQEIVVYKINNNGSFAYTKKFPTASGSGSGIFPSFTVLNNELFLAGVTNSPEFPITDNSQFYNGGSGYFTRIGATGDIIYSSFLGKMTAMLPMQYVNNKFYLLTSSDAAATAVTDSSKYIGGVDNLMMIFEPNGNKYFSTYIGGTQNENASSMEVSGTDIYMSGITYSANYPVTDQVLYKNNGDQFLTKLSFCPAGYDVTNDALLPNTQTVCKYGLAQKISGKKILVPASALPTIYLAGVATGQSTVEATYQWQIADAPGGPWTDIAGATLKDYTPVIGSIAQYYRRLAYTLPQCGNTLINTSGTATVLVNSLTAPTVNAGGPFITCPGSPVIIGGTPTATGGNPPYTNYTWDMGAAPVANPTVTPTVSTVYTLTVTDALGCQQMGQSVVFSYAANAGTDKNNCAGSPVLIGGAPVPVAGAVQYSWSPNTAINNIAIAQPTVNPFAVTNYELTLTVNKTGGGTCFTKDIVKVTPVAAPVTPSFAGPDKTFCLGDQATLGTTAEDGFNYVWSPGIYLTSNNTSTTTYSPGNLLMPEVNPATINLTAQKEGCSFSDKTIVTVIESRAGIIGCGPRIVGFPDRTPDINETYQWIKISGPGSFTGATNLPQVPVSASVGGNTIYGLIVTYNGHACFSQVTVPEGCAGCQILFNVDAKYKCPSFGINGNDVTITAYGSIGEATYQWSPQVGLSSYTSSQVKLTDNVPRTYTVTATSIYDPTLTCSETIEVNNPAYAVPIFPAPDVVACANVPTAIGAAPVAGYFYEWDGIGLSDNFVSNPFATVPIQTSFPVKITDINGCELKDTVLVEVQNVNVDAGPDWVICSNGIATLGTPAQPNTTYAWEPSASPWQNGTDQTSAQPQVLALTDIRYTVTATTTAGCVTADEVFVTINNSPTVIPASDAVVCAGKSVMIGSPALPGVTYQWFPATGLSDATLAQPMASPASNTTYNLIATFPGNCALPATDDVFVRTSTAAFNMPDINFCPGSGPVALGTAAPAGMIIYSWSPGALVTNSQIRNPSTLNPPPSVPTTFTLQVFNIDGCEATDQITITPAVLKPDAGADKTICKGNTTSIGSNGNSTGANISYNWSPVTNLSDPLSRQPVFTGTTVGTFIYILTKTDATLACSAKDTVVVTVAGDLLPLINTPTICQNSCQQIGTTPVAGLQYSWTPVTGLSNPAIANPVACVTTSTVSYQLTAKDANGCSATANIVLGVNNVPAAQLSVPTVTACVGDNNASFQPVINPAGNYSYLWSPNDGTLSDITSATPTILITDAGIKQYTLQVTDNVTGCSNSTSATLISSNCPLVATIGDRIWFDLDADGLQDAGEDGVSGMAVRLYNSADFNVVNTVTDANGFYSLTNITAGNDYYIVFSKPAGYVFTTQNVGGSNASNNSKADIAGRSNNFNVTAGTTISNIDAGIKPTGTTPVTLLTFTGALRNRQVMLNWQTTAEYNNAYFDVEKSSDRISFLAIGRVSGHGTTVLPNSYSLLDPAPFDDMNYYRLKQTDIDGKFIYSNIVAVRLNNAAGLIVYYYNKNNTAQINFNIKQPLTYMNLYAANGQLIKTASASNMTSYIFELPVLAKGIYLLKVENANLNYTEKLFINQ